MYNENVKRMTVKELVEKLTVYPENFNITNESKEVYKHMINGDDFVILSTEYPSGYSKDGENVYPKKEQVLDKYISPFEGGRTVDKEELVLKINLNNGKRT